MTVDLMKIHKIFFDFFKLVIHNKKQKESDKNE